MLPSAFWSEELACSELHPISRAFFSSSWSTFTSLTPLAPFHLPGPDIMRALHLLRRSPASNTKLCANHPSRNFHHHHSKTEDFSCPVLPNIAQVCWTLWCSRLEVLLELHGYGRQLCVSEGLREHTCKLPGIWFSNFSQKLTPLIYSSQ